MSELLNQYTGYADRGYKQGSSTNLGITLSRHKESQYGVMFQLPSNMLKSHFTEKTRPLCDLDFFKGFGAHGALLYFLLPYPTPNHHLMQEFNRVESN